MRKSQGRVTQRLDKILANMGVGTRAEVKKMIRNGEVTVDGETVTDGGRQVDPEKADILVGGSRLRYRKFIYLMMNKPPGVVSATEDVRERTVLDLLGDEYRPLAPFPVGRLDKDTTGLLLLTNDGQLAHRLLSPKRHVDKTYRAVVDGTVGEAEAERFARGVMLDDGYVTMPAVLRVIRSSPDRSEVEVTIREGKFHQVKRMFAAVGRNVLELQRLSMGPLVLDPELRPGQYRELKEEELAALAPYMH